MKLLLLSHRSAAVSWAASYSLELASDWYVAVQLHSVSSPHDCSQNHQLPSYKLLLYRASCAVARQHSIGRCRLIAG
jgi:hypothetical protein